MIPYSTFFICTLLFQLFQGTVAPIIFPRLIPGASCGSAHGASLEIPQMIGTHFEPD
jgi:hypothetical protein